jgi:proteic killer suppression protein
VQIRFRNNKLEKCFGSYKLACRNWGDDVARRYIQRIGLIQEAKDIAEVCNLPGLKCHPLKGDRQGEYAIKLTGFYRLIFTLQGEQLEIVMLEEVSKHYDD